MPVRKTETRLPPATQVADLGEAVAAPDGRSALVSFVTSPLAVGRANDYVLFVTDAALAAAATSFEWTFTVDTSAPVSVTTEHGATTFVPQAGGSLDLTVRILGTGGAEQARITMAQAIVQPNAELEDLIEEARNLPGPGVSHPDVARELVNDHNPYYQDATPTNAVPDKAYRRFLFSVVLEGALRRDEPRRRQHAARVAAALNDDEGDFVSLTAEGIGVSGIRLPLLAMIGSAPALPWTELPESAAAQAAADLDLRKALGALDESTRIDLFNLARFPKSNITNCGRVLEALRDRYFAGASFDDVLTGMSGTRAHWIARHYREGPLART